jgi:hypothetical protein
LSQNGCISLNPTITMKSKVIDDLQITIKGDWCNFDALTS